MSKIQKIFKNMSWLLISQIVASACAFIWTVLMARYLGVNDYGIFGFATSLTAILLIATDFGVNTHIIRHIATDYDSAPKYIGNAINLKVIFSIVSIFLTLILLFIINSTDFVILITLLFLIETIIKSYLNLFNGSFQAFEVGKYQGIANTLLHLVLLLLILISIYFDLGLLGIAISYILANFVALVYEYYVLNKYITKPKFEFDKKFCKNITVLSIPFAVSGILFTIYYSIDAVMLTKMVGTYATGIYNATYKLISVLTLFYSVYTAVIFPVMSKLFKNDEKTLVILFEKSIKYLMIIIIPIAISTVIYSTDIIKLIYGNEYIAASPVLSILIWTVCLLLISGACNTLLNASYKELTVTKIYAIAAVSNILLNLILIPYLSYIGAAITTVMSDVIIVGLECYIIYKLDYKPNKKLYADLIKIIIGSAILGILLYYLKHQFLL